MEIYLIRHGNCFDSTVEHFCEEKKTMNPKLTPKGIEQAYKLAERIKDISFDKIYCSDLDRAIQTAEIMQTKISADIVLTKSFHEIDMGDIYKKSWKEYPDIYAKWVLHEEDIPYPNGEKGTDVWNRCIYEINNIKKLNYNRIAIVCHGGTIRSIICGVLNIPQQKRFYFGFPPENCSISMILLKENNFFLHTFNDYSHISS